MHCKKTNVQIQSSMTVSLLLCYTIVDMNLVKGSNQSYVDFHGTESLIINFICLGSAQGLLQGLGLGITPTRLGDPMGCC